MKKIFSILLILIGIISIGSGCYLMYTDSDANSNKEEKTTEETTNEDAEKTEDAIISLSDIKDFSDYNSYQLDVEYDGVSYMTLKYDGNNNNMYLSFLGMYYIYYDITNDISYISEDGNTWSLDEDSSSSYDTSETNEISSIINMIKNGETTDNGDNSYSLSFTDEENDCDVDDTECVEAESITYDVVVTFDSNGYIKTMVMSSDESSITYVFSNIDNTTVDVIGATNSTAATE